MNNPYESFNQFVFRSPLFSFSFFINCLNKFSDSEEHFKHIINNSIVKEAIYIASPVLFEELIKYLDKGIVEKKERERFRYSMVRYLSRMSTRCTPFGLFAGCSIGHFDNQTQIKLKSITSNQRHTRLDMNYLCALIQDISKIPDIKYHTNYFSNTSLYKAGDKLRYIEYHYKGTKRIHQVVNVDNSEYLDIVMHKAIDGVKYNEIRNLLVNDDISIEEASEFIDELIESQLIVSELEPTVTGQELFDRLIQSINILAKKSNKNKIFLNLLGTLENINNLLGEIDKYTIGETIDKYKTIISEITKMKTTFEIKYLFQTDMIKPVENAILNRDIKNDLLRAIEFLNKLTPANGETLLSKFREAFQERYENKEMPLLLVLDNETGIGYRVGDKLGDVNPLVDDLLLPFQNKINYDVKWNAFQTVLLKKYKEALVKNKYTIELEDSDFENLKAKWDDLPSTLSVICQITQDNENARNLYIKMIGNSSASNLLGRFCHLDKKIIDHVLEITKKEEELNSEVIYAEIVHLPESRIGNILSRPILRPYEIPFLAKSSVCKENQILLSDLMVSIRKGRIFLRSKSLNKEVIPRLSTAHNFAFKSMPLYHFLCDMQLQNMRGGLNFSWTTIFNEYDWLPRIKYKNAIFSLARWTIKNQEVNTFFSIVDDIELVKVINIWKQDLLMPRFVVLDDGDNELFIDLENATSLRTLFSVIKNRTVFNLKEFLFDANHGIVKSDEGVFTNEFIFSFYKK